MRVWLWLPALAGLGLCVQSFATTGEQRTLGTAGALLAGVVGIVCALQAINFRSGAESPTHEHGAVTRIVATLLMAGLLVFGVWSFVGYRSFLLGPSPAGYAWWWPLEISTFGEDIDFLFRLIAVMVLVMFVLTMGMLVAFVWRYSARRTDKGVHTHGSHRLEMIWTAVPAVMLLVIAFSQLKTFNDIKGPKATKDEPVFADVFASQFDWRFRYPGPDGRLGTSDDVETAWELVVPADEKIVLNLRSRDVLHSFFVPMLRVKQDAVPGMTIPIWFQVDSTEHGLAFANQEDKSFDLICAELCGWGHYKMSGRVRVVSRSEFDAWMEAQIAQRFSNDAPTEG